MGVRDLALGARLPPYPVFACAVVFYWSLSVRALIYTVMPTIASDLGLSSSTAGSVIAGMLLGYTVASWIAGWLPGSRKVRILAGVLLSLPGALLLSTASSLWVVVVATLMVGFGVGIYIALGLALIVDVGGRGKKAQYMAFHEVAAILATFSGSSYVAVAIAWTDWRGMLLLWCAVGVVAALFFFVVRDKGEEGGRTVLNRSIPLDRTLVYGFISYGTVSILLMGLISVLPLIMVRAWGLDQAHAASVVGYTRLAGLLGVIIVGLAADRMGHRKVTFGLQLLSLVGCVAMSLNGYGPLFLVGVVLVAAGAAGTVVLVPIVIAGAYGAGQRERAIAAAIGMGGLLGMVLCPILFGILIDAGLATGPIVLAAAATVLAIAVTHQIPSKDSGLRTES